MNLDDYRDIILALYAFITNKAFLISKFSLKFCKYVVRLSTAYELNWHILKEKQEVEILLEYLIQWWG